MFYIIDRTFIKREGRADVIILMKACMFYFILNIAGFLLK